jgi:hypothetical protein
MGVSLDQLEVLITVLLVTWQTMKTSGRKWPLISEDTLERCLQRLTGKLQFIEGLSPALQQRAVDDQINQHAEPQLLAFVHGYLGDHGLLGIGTDAEKYLVLAGLNLAECVAETVPQTDSVDIGNNAVWLPLTPLSTKKMATPTPPSVSMPSVLPMGSFCGRPPSG